MRKRKVHKPIERGARAWAKDACPLVVYSLKIADNVGGMTQIAIEANTLDGKPAKGIHHCNIVVIGSPFIHGK